MMTDRENQPAAAADGAGQAVILGWLGVVPFVALAVLGWTPQPPIWGNAVFVAYSAVILSFLGGIRWGRAMSQDSAAPVEFLRSVMPSLLAWPALLLPLDTAVPALALGHAVALIFDTRADQLPSPAWFRRLRIALSLSVIACHGVVYLNLSQ